MNRVGNDVFARGALVEYAHPTRVAGRELENAQGAKKPIAFRHLLLIDTESCFAVSVVDGDRRIGGATAVVAVGQSHFIQTFMRKAGSERHRFGTLAGILIVELTQPHIRRRVGRVWPLANERRVHFIHHNAGQIIRISNEEWNQVWLVCFPRSVGVGDRIGMWLESGGTPAR